MLLVMLAAGAHAQTPTDRITIDSSGTKGYNIGCQQPPNSGIYVPEDLTFTVTVSPAGQGVTASVSPIGGHVGPNPVHTDLTVVAAASATPAVYTVQLKIFGNACFVPFVIETSYWEVRPKIIGSHELWWFDGEDEPLYTEDILLDSGGTYAGTKTWEVTQGSSKVQLVHPANGTKRTIVNTVQNAIHAVSVGGSTPGPGPGSLNDVTVTLTINGISSDPHLLTVYWPRKLFPLGELHAPLFGTHVWTTYIQYSILDHTLSDMPNVKVRLHEHWTVANTTNDPAFPSANWGMPLELDGNFFPSLFPDMIGVSAGVTPTPVAYNNGSTFVDRWTGEWYVGHRHGTFGVRVQTNRWRRLLDRAIHDQIVSPAP